MPAQPAGRRAALRGGTTTAPGLDLRAAIRLGVSLSLDEIAADEFFAMLAIEAAQDQYEKEQAGTSRNPQC